MNTNGGGEAGCLSALLISFGAIENPTSEQLDCLVECRAMNHETLGRMVHTQLKNYLLKHGGDERLEAAAAIAARVGNGSARKRSARR